MREAAGIVALALLAVVLPLIVSVRLIAGEVPSASAMRSAGHPHGTSRARGAAWFALLLLAAGMVLLVIIAADSHAHVEELLPLWLFRSPRY